jgi:hypothetical protein
MSGETLTEELSTSATLLTTVPKQKQRNDIPVPSNGTEYIIEAKEYQENRKNEETYIESDNNIHQHIPWNIQGIKKSMDGI